MKRTFGRSAAREEPTVTNAEATRATRDFMGFITAVR
jgi:hypothetical protein